MRLTASIKPSYPLESVRPMNNPIFYSLIFLGTVLIATAATIAAWHRRRAPGGLALFLMLVAVLVWNLAGMMEGSIRGGTGG